MELIDCLNSRRSVRKFLAKPVAERDVKKIIEAGLRAPSSKNSAPWFFLVLGKDKKAEICQWVRDNKSQKRTQPADPVTGKPAAKSFDSTEASLGIIENAPVLILILNRSPFIGGRARLAQHPSAEDIFTYATEIIGIGACMENILLASHGLDLAAVPLADVYPAEDEIKEKYQLPYDLVLGIALGYPAYQPGPRPKKEEGFVKYNLK